MSEAAVAEAPIAGMEFDGPEIVLSKPKELAVQCVVFVGNWLTPIQMRAPNYRLGGKVFPFPAFNTVPNGVVMRCNITRLRDGYRSVHMEHIPENERKQWVESYTLKNQWDPATQKYRDIVVGDDENSKPLLYKVIKPVAELRGILQHGVVALDEFCGIEKGSHVKEAQFYYFPNWLEILTGKEYLPNTLRVLEDHLRERREQTNSPQMRAIGDAFLQSCVQYRDAAMEFTAAQTAANKEHDNVNGRYDEVAERIFKEVELTREDKLHENTARNQTDTQELTHQMVTAVSKLTDFVTSQKVAAATLPPVEAQPPAPQTIEAAKVEMDMANEEEVVEFTDMSEVVVEEISPEAAEVDKYLAETEAETVEEE